VTEVKATKQGIEVGFAGSRIPSKDSFDCVLIAVGRVPNGHNIGANEAGINVDERGFIAAGNQQRTNISNIFAIGDVAGQLMLAHKGKIAAEVALAIKMGCDAEDIRLTIHPHPTLSETIAFSAEAFEDTITDLYMPKRP